MRRTHAQRGTQLVELAIVLPLLCFIVVAIIDGADLVRTHLLLNNAAREGARMAAELSCQNCSASTVQSFIRNYVVQYINNETNGLGIGGSGGKDAWCSPTAFGASNVTVNTTGSYTFNDPSTGQTMTNPATVVSINFTYQFCYVPSFASYFGGMSTTLPLYTEATFANFTSNQ